MYNINSISVKQRKDKRLNSARVGLQSKEVSEEVSELLMPRAGNVNTLLTSTADQL